MDYRKTAQEIYDHVGKKENIISAAHCATRLIRNMERTSTV